MKKYIILDTHFNASCGLLMFKPILLNKILNKGEIEHNDLYNR